MKFFSTKELAEKWGVDQSRILRLAYDGRIEGATHIGSQWMFPSNAKKPVDGRTKKAKAGKNSNVFFRFPLYVNFEEKDYVPTLSDEEKSLRMAQIAFQACRFKEAKSLLYQLQNAKNRYVRLSALYHSLYIAMYDNSPDFDSLLWRMNAELSQDFPYKNEMLMLRYGFDADCTSYRSALEEFEVNPTYTYVLLLLFLVQLADRISIIAKGVFYFFLIAQALPNHASNAWFYLYKKAERPLPDTPLS